MKLPKDTNEWHTGHLIRAVRQRDEAFEKYERLCDLDSREKSQELYADYQRKDQLVLDIRRVLGERV